jgi:thimet oligopeptidase
MRAVRTPLVLITLLAALSASAQSPPASSSPSPQSPPALRFTWTAKELDTACQAAEQETDAALKALVAIPDDKRTFDDSFVAFDRVVTGYEEKVWRLGFMKDIHQDQAVRDAGAACEERAGKYLVNLRARKDLFLALDGYLKNGGTRVRLDSEAGRLVETTMLEFKKNGVMLNDADKAKLINIRSRLTELQTRYGKTLNEDKTTLVFKASDLEGLPADFIAAHEDKKKKGRFVLTTKYPDYYPVMEHAKKEATRKKMELAFMNRGGKKNHTLLDEAVKLRAEAAQLLGFASHTDAVAADRMAKDAATIQAFLTRLRDGLKPALENERAAMLALKQQDDPKAKTINAWDWRYYQTRVKERDHAINDDEVRSYFPADVVMAGMFSTYETVLGITLQPVKDAPVWADGVTLYEVKDKSSGDLVAKFYVDLFPREGKYGHAAEFTLSSGQMTEAGYRVPMCALVMNVQPPKDGKPSFLSMSEVETLFHEFGHVMHESLTTARFASLSGTRTALDFVEAPSQMLENWAYEADVLKLISRDPKDPTKPMPQALADKLRAARHGNAGVHNSRQVFLATFDQTLHTRAATEKTPVNSDAVAKKVWADVLAFPEDKGGHFAGTFGHMMGGYEGGYYGYLWSEVFAADMFTRFAKEGVLNPVVGKAYRDLILARGRTEEPAQLLKAFLGREPSEAAFLGQLGIVPTSL